MMKKFVLSNKPLDVGDAHQGPAGLQIQLLTKAPTPPRRTPAG